VRPSTSAVKPAPKNTFGSKADRTRIQTNDHSAREPQGWNCSHDPDFA
jgi:hypothetical protein